MACPRKYRYQYIDKEKSPYDPESPDQALGNAIHETMEYFYKKLNGYSTVTLDAMLAHFQSVIASKWDDETMADYEYTSYCNRGNAYLTMYRNRYAPFEHIAVLGNEIRLSFFLDDAKQYAWQGYIDRLDKKGDTFIINDYKTGKNLTDTQRAEHHEQLVLYAHGVKQKYPGMVGRIEANLYYLHFDLVDTREVTEAEITAVREKYLALHHKIDQATFSYKMGDPAPFAPIQST